LNPKKVNKKRERATRRLNYISKEKLPPIQITPRERKRRRKKKKLKITTKSGEEKGKLQPLRSPFEKSELSLAFAEKERKDGLKWQMKKEEKKRTNTTATPLVRRKKRKCINPASFVEGRRGASGPGLKGR